MNKEPRLSHQTLAVLGAFASNPRRELSGAQISRLTGLPSGTLYPMLLRLEKAGWLRSRWEVEEPQVLGRPRRRFYRITGEGAKHGHAAMRELNAAFGRLAWNT
jgi:PadR family transcriptional regulator, regulatory protein PadR